MADNRPVEPSAYVFRWTIFSTLSVLLGAVFVLMWSLAGSSLGPGIIIGVLIAAVGGIAFAFVPRASLNRKNTPMTANARRKAAEQKKRSES